MMILSKNSRNTAIIMKFLEEIKILHINKLKNHIKIQLDFIIQIKIDHKMQVLINYEYNYFFKRLYFRKFRKHMKL